MQDLCKNVHDNDKVVQCNLFVNSLSSNKNFTDSEITHWKDLENDHDSSLPLKPSSNLEPLVNQFNNAIPENSNGPEKISSYIKFLLSIKRMNWKLLLLKLST